MKITAVQPSIQFDGIGGVDSLEPGSKSAPSATKATDGASFEGLLKDMVGKANELDAVANEKSQALAAGATDDIHGTMIANKEAEISMKLVGSIRNKLLDAFHEIWRTGV